MSTFFSGTDVATLKEEGRDRNNFVSLIVNNAGSYTAAITRRIKDKDIKESISYEFFGEGEKHDVKEYSPSENEIEWFYLKIEKEGDTFSFQDMDARLEEIRRKKAEKAEKQTSKFIPYGLTPSNSYSTNVGPANFTSKSTPIQRPLFDDIDDFSFDYSDQNISYDTLTFDKNIIKQLTLQLVTGSIIIPNDSKIDIRKWVESMPVMYQKRFGKGKKGMDLFELWVDTYTEFLTWNAVDDNLKAQGIGDTEMCAICAHDMIKELDKLPQNDYIKACISALQKYLIL